MRKRTRKGIYARDKVGSFKEDSNRSTETHPECRCFVSDLQEPHISVHLGRGVKIETVGVCLDMTKSRNKKQMRRNGVICNKNETHDPTSELSNK